MKARHHARSLAAPALAALILAAATPVVAGVGRWTRIGPDGGGVLSLAPHPSDPEVAFAGTYDGVYVTEDGGLTWRRRTRQHVHQPWVRWLAVDPERTDRLYAVYGVGSERRMVRSDDSGRTWVEIAENVGEWYGRGPELAADGTVFMAIHGWHLHRSRDAGGTWEPLDGAPVPIYDVAVSPSEPRIVYAADDRDVFRSDDGGDTWRPCGRPEWQIWYPKSVTVDFADPGLLYVPEIGSVAVSRDGCTTWERSELRSAYWVNQMAADPLRPGTVFLGADLGPCVSSDRGATWAPVGSGVETFYASALAPNPVDPARILMAVDWPLHARGVYGSEDGGISWRFSVEGVTAVPVSALLRDPANPSRLVAETRISEDLGHSWHRLEGGDEIETVLAIAPSDPAIWFATPAIRRGLLRSTDRGRSWAPVSTQVWAHHLTVHPTDPARLHAGYLHSGTWSASSWSRDGGSTWQPAWVDEGILAFGLGHDPHRPGVIWAATRTGPWRSLDDGETWTHAVGLRARPLPSAPAPTPARAALHPLTGIAVDPHDPDRILGWTCDAVIRSTDGGRTWRFARDGLEICSSRDEIMPPGCPTAKWIPPISICAGGPTSLAFDPQVPGHIYAATSNGPYRSLDGGASWSPLPGPPTNHEMTGLVVLGGGRVLAGTSYSGVLDYREVVQGEASPSGAR